MLRAVAVEAEVEVELKIRVVLVKTAVAFPNMVLIIARRTIPGVIDALILVVPGLSDMDSDCGAAVDVGSVRRVLPTDVDSVRTSGVEPRLGGALDLLLAAVLDLETTGDDLEISTLEPGTTGLGLEAAGLDLETTELNLEASTLELGMTWAEETTAEDKGECSAEDELSTRTPLLLGAMLCAPPAAPPTEGAELRVLVTVMVDVTVLVLVV